MGNAGEEVPPPLPPLVLVLLHPDDFVAPCLLLLEGVVVELDAGAELVVAVNGIVAQAGVIWLLL